MLKGFEMAGKRQCRRRYYDGISDAPCAVCALGAYSLGLTGNANFNDTLETTAWQRAKSAFHQKAGFGIVQANDDEFMSIPDIAGILAAEGY